MTSPPRKTSATTCSTTPSPTVAPAARTATTAGRPSSCSCRQTFIPTQNPLARGEEPNQIYADNSFHNIGLPPNPEAASFDPSDPDLGLAEFTGVPGTRRRLPHSDAPQRRHAPRQRVSEGLHAQWLLQDLRAGRALLQHRDIEARVSDVRRQRRGSDRQRLLAAPETPSVLPLTGLVGRSRLDGAGRSRLGCLPEDLDGHHRGQGSPPVPSVALSQRER